MKQQKCTSHQQIVAELDLHTEQEGIIYHHIGPKAKLPAKLYNKTYHPNKTRAR